MRFKLAGALGFLLILTPFSIALSQSPNEAAAAQEAMKKLSKMVGHWEGEATVVLGPGETKKVKQHEVVQSKLNGTVLLVEGTGTEPGDDGKPKTVFQALAVCNYDTAAKAYKFHAFRDNGRSTMADAELTENGLIWGFEDGRGGKVRYEITLTEDTWVEKGEYIRPGQPPFKIIEMNLKRIPSPASSAAR